jgi:cytochrome c-type biogenesis protein CcmF
VAGHRFEFKGVQERRGPNYVALRATIEVQRETGACKLTMHPEKRLYKVQQMPMTEAAIDTGLTRDLYVSLGEPLDEPDLDRARLRQALRRLDLGRLRC